MLIRHLSFFVTLAEVGHFAKAAALCHVTQPTLSAAIRKLEEDLATRLIVRANRYMGLTAEGERVLVWGRQILFDYESLRKDIGGANRSLSGTLRLGVIPTAMPVVSFLSERFTHEHNQVHIDIKSMSSRAIQHGLDTFELDGGLTYLENEALENVERLPLYHERYIFVCRADHPFAGLPSVSWQAAVAEPLCLLSEDMQNRRILESRARSLGLRLRPSVVSNSVMAICSHIRNGGWCSIIPHTFFYIFGSQTNLATVALEQFPKSGNRFSDKKRGKTQKREHGSDLKIATIALEDNFEPQTIGLVTSSRLPVSPMTRALIHTLKGLNFTQDFFS